MKTNIRRGVAVVATVAAMAGASCGLAGTASAATITPESPLTGKVSRVAGTDRIDTALKAATQIFGASPTTPHVYITRDSDFADALSAGPLAFMNKGAILVNPTATLDLRVQTQLQNWAAAGVQVTIVGGSNAISDNVAAAIITAVGATPGTGVAKAPGTASVVRLQGTDRYATSLAVAEKVAPVVDGTGKSNGVTGDAFLATGRDFADALTAGAAAAHDGNSPVILTDGSTLSADAQAYIAARTANSGVVASTNTSYAVGGAAAAALPTAVSLAGADRYATSALVASKFWAPLSTDTNTISVGIASGETFADAVIGANVIAQTSPDGPLLLTNPTSLSAATQNYLNTNRQAVKQAFIFGGTSTITFDVSVQADKTLVI